MLFVGTVEPRKNLAGSVEAIARLRRAAAARGRRRRRLGRRRRPLAGDVRFLGFVPAADLGGAVRRRRGVLLSERARGLRPAGARGDGPGHPGGHQRGTATEEAAGGAAVLVDPLDADDIARGITEALDRTPSWPSRGRGPGRRGHMGATAAAHRRAYRELC